jgi:hypothetical protein
VSVALVSGLYYLGTRRKKRLGFLDENHVPASYSWAGSLLLGLLCCYELRPVGVAVGWAVLALVLLEIGVLRHRAYLRHQALALLAASFVRIFFVNLNAGSASSFFSPRMYTMLPLIAAYLWTYERLRKEDSCALDRIAGGAACWFGTIAVTALVYVEARPVWVVIAWAVLVFILLTLSWLLKREIFLQQGLVMTAAVFLRALLFNLLGAAYLRPFTERPVFCIGAAAAILFLTQPIAFRLRRREEKVDLYQGWRAWLKLAGFRPEQLLFFFPLVLVAIMLAHEMRAGMITVSWSALGVAVFLLALLVRERSYRLAGLGLLLLGVGKILLIDIWKLAPTDRYVTLIVMGIALLTVSFLYTRYREAILKFL